MGQVDVLRQVSVVSHTRHLSCIPSADRWQSSEHQISRSALQSETENQFVSSRRSLQTITIRRTFLSLVNRNPFPSLLNIETLQKDKYDETMTKAIGSATLLKSLEKCDTINSNMHNLIRNQNT